MPIPHRDIERHGARVDIPDLNNSTAHSSLVFHEPDGGDHRCVRCRGDADHVAARSERHAGNNLGRPVGGEMLGVAQGVLQRQRLGVPDRDGAVRSCREQRAAACGELRHARREGNSGQVGDLVSGAHAHVPEQHGVGARVAGDDLGSVRREGNGSDAGARVPRHQQRDLPWSTFDEERHLRRTVLAARHQAGTVRTPIQSGHPRAVLHDSHPLHPGGRVEDPPWLRPRSPLTSRPGSTRVPAFPCVGR